MLAAVAAILMAASTSAAGVKQDKSGWICGSPQDWEVASLEIAPKLILNNFFFEESSRRRTGMKVLKVSFSTLNRTSDSYRMSGQFVGFDQTGSLTFAFSASPRVEMITLGPPKVEPGPHTASGEVYVAKPILPKTTKICATFSVEAPKRE